MTMTVSRLHKLLGALIDAGHGRKPVLVDRSTFRDPRDNDGLLMLPPWQVRGPRWIPTADDDGGTKWNKDGTESGQQCVLIVGDCAEQEAATGVMGAPAPEPCPRGADKPEASCTNRHQCWEPCGELGKSAEHVRVGRQDPNIVGVGGNDGR